MSKRQTAMGTQSIGMGRTQHIHFIGIGGVGMCGIAEILILQGYHVSGSDRAANPVIERLVGLGAVVHMGHQADHIRGANVVVRSSAIDDNNPEMIAAREADIPILERAQMLAELMRCRQGIAIAGTHGKTTTTSLMSSVLIEANLDPSFVIGGSLLSLGSTARLGQSPYFVVEADESDASFLYLSPQMAVVTNIDADHMSTYGGELSRLRQAFVDFLHRMPFYGVAILCIDDSEIEAIRDKVSRPTLSYGFHPDADIRAYEWKQSGLKSTFKVARRGFDTDLSVEFAFPGKHNVRNALAVIAVASELGLSEAAIELGIQRFKGVGRRFQIYGELAFRHGQALLVDDYGHHPKEIESTISAVRQVWPDKRLILAFQPHRYSRTKALFDDFVKALSAVDQLVLLDIFPAGEPKLDGISSNTLAEQVMQNKHDLTVNVVSGEHLSSTLNSVVRNGDIVLTQGAGDIGRMAAQLNQLHRDTPNIEELS